MGEISERISKGLKVGVTVEEGFGVTVAVSVGVGNEELNTFVGVNEVLAVQASRTSTNNAKKREVRKLTSSPPNGLRYLRWGGDGEAVQPEKC